jgi:hypothetical protein
MSVIYTLKKMPQSSDMSKNFPTELLETYIKRIKYVRIPLEIFDKKISLKEQIEIKLPTVKKRMKYIKKEIIDLSTTHEHLLNVEQENKKLKTDYKKFFYKEIDRLKNLNEEQIIEYIEKELLPYIDKDVPLQEYFILLETTNEIKNDSSYTPVTINDSPLDTENDSDIDSIDIFYPSSRIDISEIKAQKSLKRFI